MADTERQRPADFIHDFFKARAEGEDVSSRCTGKLAKFELWLFQTMGELPKLHVVFTLDSAKLVKEDETTAVVDIRASLAYVSIDGSDLRLPRESRLNGPVVLQKTDPGWCMVDFTRDGRSVLAAMHEHDQTFNKGGYSLEVRGLLAILLSFLVGWMVAGPRPAPSLDAGAIAVGNSFLGALEEQDWRKVETFIAEPRLIQDLQGMRNLRRAGEPEISSAQFFTLRDPHLEYPIKAAWGECGYAKRLALYMKMNWRGDWEIEWTAFTHVGTCVS